MTKEKHVKDIISEELRHYHITQELIEQCAENIVYSLDMWREFSGEYIADSNLIAHKKNEENQKIVDAKKETERTEQYYLQQIEEWKDLVRNLRWRISQLENK